MRYNGTSLNYDFPRERESHMVTISIVFGFVLEHRNTTMSVVNACADLSAAKPRLIIYSSRFHDELISHPFVVDGFNAQPTAYA
jgi:hypothetical protein